MTERQTPPRASLASLVEILGLLLALVGLGAVTAAAVMVSVALGVLVAGLGLTLTGVVAVWVAAQLERAPAPVQPDDEPTV
jgi:hypothetical protein